MKKKRLSNLSHNFINNYTLQQDGDGHILIPVVMMVEGVHNGSRGPMLYTTSELTASASDWDGFPIVINHPKDSHGNYIPAAAANEEDVVGTISNSHMQGNKLKAEMRIDTANLERLSEDMMDDIRDNHPIDVSIGLASTDELVDGTFNNIPYKGIVHNIQPDHLALLVGEEGACSWDAGCGIRNKKNNLSTKNRMKNEKKVKLENTGVLLTLNDISVKLFGDSELANNELGYREIGRGIQNHLNTLDTSTTYYYLEEVFDDYFIYRVSNNETNSSDFYKKSYQVNASDEVELTEDTVKVQRKVSYEVVTNTTAKMVRTKFNGSQIKTKKEMTKNEKSSPCKVDAVIANTVNQFTQDDREFLEGLGDAQLDKFIPAKSTTANTKPTSADAEVKVTEEQIQAVLNNVKDPVEFVDKFLPKGVSESIKAGMQLNNENRDKFIKGIIANSAFTEENLKGWDTVDLQKMYDSVSVNTEEPPNYSGQIVNRGGASEATEDMAVMLNIKKEDK